MCIAASYGTFSNEVNWPYDISGHKRTKQAIFKVNSY
jgi:hypothetical protein